MRVRWVWVGGGGRLCRLVARLSRRVDWQVSGLVDWMRVDDLVGVFVGDLVGVFVGDLVGWLVWTLRRRGMGRRVHLYTCTNTMQYTLAVQYT